MLHKFWTYLNYTGLINCLKQKRMLCAEKQKMLLQIKYICSTISHTFQTTLHLHLHNIHIQ